MKEPNQKMVADDNMQPLRSPVTHIHFASIDKCCRGVVEVKRGKLRDRMTAAYILKMIYGKPPKEIMFQDGEVIRCENGNPPNGKWEN